MFFLSFMRLGRIMRIMGYLFIILLKNLFRKVFVKKFSRRYSRSVGNEVSIIFFMNFLNFFDI